MSAFPNNPEYVAKALQDFKKRDWNGKRFTEVVNDFRTIFKMIPLFPINVKKGTILFSSWRGLPNLRLSKRSRRGLHPLDLCFSATPAYRNHRTFKYGNKMETR